MHWMLALAASWAGAASAAPIKIEPVETPGAMVEHRDGMADLTVTVTLAGEAHRFPLKVTRYR